MLNFMFKPKKSPFWIFHRVHDVSLSLPGPVKLCNRICCIDYLANIKLKFLSIKEEKMKKVFITEFEHDLHGLQYESCEVSQKGALFEFVMDVKELKEGDLIMFCGDFYTVKRPAEVVEH